MCVRRFRLYQGLLACVLCVGATMPGRAADELVGLWRFDNADNLGMDSSAVGNDLAVEGGASYDADGKFDGAADFDGVDGMLVPEAAFPLGIPVEDDTYTIAAWIRPTATTNEVGYPAGMVGWGTYGQTTASLTNWTSLRR
jgi:hypothetical protein